MARRRWQLKKGQLIMLSDDDQMLFVLLFQSRNRTPAADIFFIDDVAPNDGDEFIDETLENFIE